MDNSLQFKLTAEGFANKLNSEPASEVQNIFRKYAGFELTNEELQLLYNNKGYKNSPIPLNNGQRLAMLNPCTAEDYLPLWLTTSKLVSDLLQEVIPAKKYSLQLITRKALYLLGMHSNVELNHYLCALFGINGELDAMSNQTFAKHTEVFKNYKCEIVPAKDGKSMPTLVVKSKKKQLTITPFSNLIQTGKRVPEQSNLIRL